MKIGVISDTHGLLRPEATAALEGVDHILHGGDIGEPTIVTALEEIAPVTAIRGNVDTGKWAEAYPATCLMRLGGHAIYILHDRNALTLDPAAERIDVVVSGHSHKPSIEREGPVLFVNPGSAGRKRFRLPVTLAMLDVSGARPEAHLVDLSL